MKENFLLAEFMGWEYKHNSFLNIKKDDLSAFYQHPDFRSCYLKDMQYHKSWDWLMPVLCKIDNCKSDTKKWTKISTSISNNKTLILVSGSVNNIIISRNEDHSKLLKTYYACVDFVKWYNQQ